MILAVIVSFTMNRYFTKKEVEMYEKMDQR